MFFINNINTNDDQNDNNDNDNNQNDQNENAKIDNNGSGNSNNTLNHFNGCSIRWVSPKRFNEVIKSKKSCGVIEIVCSSGEEMIFKGYNILKREPDQEEGSMTRSEFIELHGQLSAKAEQRISDMLTVQTKQVTKLIYESEERQIARNKVIEEKLLAYKTEMNQKFNLVFATMEENHSKLTDMLYEIKEDVEMLKSFHKEDIKKYKERKDNDNDDKSKK